MHAFTQTTLPRAEGRVWPLSAKGGASVVFQVLPSVLEQEKTPKKKSVSGSSPKTHQRFLTGRCVSETSSDDPTEIMTIMSVIL